MMPVYRVTCEEVHKVEIEIEAISADEAMNKVEDNEWDENTFIVDDETVDRAAVSAIAVEEDELDPEA